MSPDCRNHDEAPSDLLPTIYYCLDLPLPRYLEGALLPVFPLEQLSRKPPVYADDTLYIEQPESAPLSEGDRDALRDQLRALGYIQ